MTIRKPGAIVLLLILTVGLFSCGKEDIVWTRSFDFRGNTWHRDNHLQFVPDTFAIDSVEAKSVLLTLRYSADATKQEFPIVVEMESPSDGYYRCDTIRETLLPSEERTGDNSAYGIFEKTDTLRLEKTPKPGWKMTISQASTDEEIHGIFSITVALIGKKLDIR